MIQIPRETEKQIKTKSPEEEFKEVKQELADVKLVLDDIILNGGTL